jgi:hypothetical protein
LVLTHVLLHAKVITKNKAVPREIDTSINASNLLQ